MQIMSYLTVLIEGNRRQIKPALHIRWRLIALKKNLAPRVKTLKDGTFNNRSVKHCGVAKSDRVENRKNK